ncbi:hypothetical protein [uncultured Eubacterium sp.]|uniref:hypothetical protein n=1 Tax=uncultured Eubacterium sp. TaxID=165185 RepID=UPI0025DA9A37|nr:hypothetical protein [uncultured Eubacterium sp.]
MKKTFKKFVACLLTVLMVATALPLSVFASDESTTTLPVTTGIAVCNNAKNTRVESDGSFNIVNDGSDTNFSIGFWKYDISALKAVGATVTSANVNVNVKTVGDDCTGLSFYYGTNSASDAITSGASLPDSIKGTNDKHLDQAKEYFGLQNSLIKTVEKADVKVGTYTIDIAAAINASIAAGLNYCTLMVTQKTFGGRDGNNGWSDTHIANDATPIKVSYTVASGMSGVQAVTSSMVGLIQQNKNGNRLESSRMNIVNDNQDDNFTVGFWKFDITSLKKMGAEVTQAKMNIAVKAKDEKCQGLSFYVASQGTSTLKDGDNQVAAIYGHGDGTHQAQAVQYFGLGTPFATVTADQITAGSNISVDIASAINNAIAVSNGANASSTDKLELTVMVMQSSADTTDQWTDTWLSNGSVTANCAYTINVDDIGSGVAALQKAIGIYETKMSNLSNANQGMYTNMLPAYNAYVKACAALEASEYGNNADATADFDTLAQDLLAKTLKMTEWVDNVTGKYQSKVPSFQNTDAATMTSKYKTFYNNIIYTESCLGGNSEYNDDSNPSGLAGEFDTAENFRVQLYYPNTILLYDGSETGTRMPVMLMGKNNDTSGGAFKSTQRFIFRCYPTTDGAAKFNEGAEFVGNDGAFLSLSKKLNDSQYAWKGAEASKNLNFDSARSDSYRIGASSDEKFTSYKFNNTLWNGSRRGCWCPYATGFMVDNTGFEYQIGQQYKGGDGIGIMEVATKWAYYGSGDSSKSDSCNDTVRGYMGSDKLKHHIYVVNYKAIVDATKNADTRQRLANVSNYKEGGLSGVISALSKATSFDVNSVTIDNISAKNKEITKFIDDAKAAPTADVDMNSYAKLQSEILTSKKIYVRGNADNKNYTAESWTVFETAYNNAVNTVSGFYNKTADTYGIVTKDANTLYTTLEQARKALVLNKTVVDTTVLQYAIDNADAILDNMNYFVDSTIDEPGLTKLISDAKIAIWGKESDYGFDPSKIDDSEVNRAKVDDYLNKIVAEVNKAVIDVTAVVPEYNYNINTAIEAGKGYESTKDQYGNYNVLASAVTTAEQYRDAIPTINARIENQVSVAIKNYISIVNAIGDAIAALRPSFRIIETGTMAQSGTVITTRFTAARSDQYSYQWTHPTDRIYFITDSKEYNAAINTSWTAYNAQTGDNFETILDSINVKGDTTTESGELTSGYTTGWGWPSEFSMTQSQINLLKGNLGLVVPGMTVTWNNFKVTKRSGAQGLGIDAAGNVVPNENMDTDFTSVLAVTEGLNRRPGGIMAKSGETVFNNTVNFNIPSTADKALIAENKPSAISARLDSNSLGLNMGLVFLWRYTGTVFNNWTGYSYARNMYDLDIGFVNVSTLFRLIDQFEDPAFLATANNYTTKSWNNLLAAVANGKGDMDYGNMTYEQIVAECDTRYNNILAAKRNLTPPASNAKLKEIYNKAKDVYDNKRATVKPSCWDSFALAYEYAAAKYNNEYSDTNVRNYDESEQDAIDAVTKKLEDAYNALIYVADFTPVDNAVKELAASVDSYKYTAESIRSLQKALDGLTYYSKTKEERATYYTDQMDLNGEENNLGQKLNISQGINKEALTTIPNLKNLLVEAKVDPTALEGAKADAKAKKNDPDAYDQAKIDEALNKLNAYEKVTLATESIYGAKYTSQDALDADVQKALEGISLKIYTININGAKYGEFEYGQEITVPSNDGKVDWYYESTSPTSSTAKKYMTTDDAITFVVKGNTNLTTKKASNTQTYKVTYVNGINSIPYAVDYVPAGSSITVGTQYDTTNAYTVPQVAYYDFTNYTVNGNVVASGEPLTINANTVITANYNAPNPEAGEYQVTVLNLSMFGGRHKNDPTITGLHYNDELSFTKGAAEGEGYYGKNLYYDKTCYATGSPVTENVEKLNAGRLNTATNQREDVYAWLEINPTDLNAWLTAWKGNKFWSTTSTYNWTKGVEYFKQANAKVVAYGTDYTFRVSKPNTVLLAVTKTEYTKLQEDTFTGFYNKENKFDENGASVTTQDRLVISNGKFSMVSTFALPEGARMVETGILYSATTGSKTMFDGAYTLGNVSPANNLIRIKSTAHTVGNQYVCSLTHTSLKGKKVSEVPMKWVAYMVYEKDGKKITKYSEPTEPSNLDDTL